MVVGETERDILWLASIRNELLDCCQDSQWLLVRLKGTFCGWLPLEANELELLDCPIAFYHTCTCFPKHISMCVVSLSQDYRSKVHMHIVERRYV